MLHLSNLHCRRCLDSVGWDWQQRLHPSATVFEDGVGRSLRQRRPEAFVAASCLRSLRAKGVEGCLPAAKQPSLKLPRLQESKM